MTGMIDFFIAISILFITILIGLPISYSMGVTAFSYIIITDPSNLVVVPNRIFAGINQFILMAIPFFILAAEIMVTSDISKKLFDFGRLFFGRFRGGLAIVNVFGSTIFGSISGTALGDVAGLGAVEIDAMNKDGYNSDFSCALTAASALQSPLIPPSNIALVYAGVAGLSVGALFMAGVVPGLLIGGSQILYIMLIRNKMAFPKDEKKYTKQEIIQIVKDGIITMLMPVIILGGILSGAFTATEAACVAVLYSLFIGIVVYRNFKFKDFVRVVKNTLKTTANIFLIIAFANIFAWIMSIEKVPELIANLMLSISSNKYILLFIANIFLIIVGMWMDTGAAIILFAPILAPIMYKVGVHPVHFAMVMLLNLTLGLITPPVGVVLYSTCLVGKRRFEDVIRQLVPFLILGFIVLFLVTYIPETVLFIPRLMGFIE